MAKTIMIQGTMSNAGKSLLAAGLCRIFRQDGCTVAPFKSQNMALNSYVTDDGLEMGRAQVMQAEASGIRPEVSMNPILLKPTSHMGSQLVVNGEVCGNFTAAEYYRMKKALMPKVLRAFKELSERFEVIVIEGAGSPAEINLREHDIVNMGLAEAVDAPVLLVGDIDRGGVFAQLYGTAALLSGREQERIKAFLINKFRGDKELLKPGLSMLYERIAIPVAGVIPYMDVDLDDEDSLAERLGSPGGRKNGVPLFHASQGTEAFETNGAADFGIAVVRFPRMSNFTDFNVLERLPGAVLSYVTRPKELAKARLIILPGSKNTMGDLHWLRESGLEAAIVKRAHDAMIFGVCGGFQMLGEYLEDPDGVEEGGRMQGIGLLPVRTRFTKEKTRTRVTGYAAGFGGARLVGYELHMGETVRTGGLPFAEIKDGKTQKEDGCVLGDVYGTYIHGAFDSKEMQRALWEHLTKKKGALRSGGPEPDFADAAQYKEMQYEKLADSLRENLDMELLYRILNREL
ncbi:MAG: cobyric acid synthase [Lachnospiraceae bacterium]|nr:cobyric acid synthase [Lachnospiraceae bacterium]